MNNTTHNALNKTQAAADHLAAQGQRLFDSAQDKVNQVAEAGKDKLEDARQNTQSWAHAAADQLQALSERCGESASAWSEKSREQCTRAMNRTSDYIKEQPLKSALLAVGAGAVLAMLFAPRGRR